MVIPYRPKAWHLMLVVAIALFDAVVLYMVLFPNVSADYRAYYIDRTASCFPRADNVATGYYPLGEPINFVTGNNNIEPRNGYSLDTLRYCGFMPPSSTGIRSFGDYGIIRFKGPFPADDLLLTFASWTNTGADKPRREVEVEANGEEIGTLVYTTRDQVNGKMVIPQRVVEAGKGWLEIRFNVPRIGPPGTNSEPVTLQLRLEAMRLSALHDPAPAPPPAGTIIEDPPSKKAGSPPPPKGHKHA
jgi:hypothetical protein